MWIEAVMLWCYSA